MSKHTPGPWQVAMQQPIDGLGVRGLAMVQHTDGNVTRVIAELIGPNDASLIAAAPELLAALKTLLNATSDARWPMTAEHMAPLNVARAAIAKAEGK